ncbi:MAG: GNAT family N-acetyltransferase [Hespellia sp.]|nr:GNAT family N-acetyltransferase [Hespellia sp.]
MNETKINETIIFREYKESDHFALSEIIRKTWQYDQLCSPKTAKKLSCTYLDCCLTDQTFTQVAVADGIPVGIIMGKNNRTHKCPLRFRLKLIKSAAMLFFSKEGRRISKIFSCVEDIDKNLQKNSPISYQGEVTFFAIDSKFRGMGLGKKLFQSLQNYMKSENIHNFFLFTDTTCNYPFYEHQGMIRRGEQTHSFEISGPLRTQTLFIYDDQM